MVDHLYPHSSAPPSSVVGIAIFILPKELTPQWDKQPLGNQVITDVASLLKFGNTWQCRSYFYLYNSSVHTTSGDVPGLSGGPATLSIACRINHVLVGINSSSSYVFVIEYVP